MDKTMPKKSRNSSMRQKSRGGDKVTSHPSSTDDTDVDYLYEDDDSGSATQLTGKHHSPGERLLRSRERNRIHARKTRQRKKEQMQNLQKRADELKQEQIRLKQSINEKATASILVGLFSKDSSSEQMEDPRVEALLRRPIDEIPDASKLPELPALILPGQHNSKKHKSTDSLSTTTNKELPNDGIDYDLLGKDRSKCTPAELDQIRRERNRMHAKRTRDRKRLFMEEMADMCTKLEDENKILQCHLAGISGLKQAEGTPVLSSEASLSTVTPLHMEENLSFRSLPASKPKLSDHGVTLDQIKTLLEAAGTFTNAMSTSPASASTSASEGGSLSDHDQDSYSSRKRRKMDNNVPQSIMAASPPTAVGV